ncbi:MAG: aspartate aminotransferase [Bacteroidetes bacterium QH_10_64_37]|jgi:aspartate aminotransferase/aspartate/glutamate/aspartate-prephenate aminotransferase|nr:MAG: aspartate aminotransferase [Bacteroidetes bacterium QH_10_64_37]
MSPTTTSIRFNDRVDAMQPSATLAMKSRAEERRRQGHPVVALSAGEPDFDTPEPIANAGVKAIRNGFTHYTENPGTLELREAICRKLDHDNDLSYTPDQVVCSNGAKQSLALAIHALCDEGDEVLVPAPYWVSYPEMARFSGAAPVEVLTGVENEYRLTPEQLDDALTERTRVLILCSPSNPTGTVYPPEELAALAEVVRDYEHVYVVSDEIYEHVLYDAEHRAFASFPDMKDRTITVNGFSKAYAMTGWRLGYMAAPEPIAQAAAKVQGQFTSAPCSITQKAGVAALEMDKGPVHEMVAAFRRRRDAVLRRLRAIDGVRCPTPEGAFYLYPDVSSFFGAEAPDGSTIEDSGDLCFYLLEEHDVALVPGPAFGAPDGLRLSYASSMEDLETALDRIEAGLAALR